MNEERNDERAELERAELHTRVKKRDRSFRRWYWIWTGLYFVSVFGGGLASAGVTVSTANLGEVSEFVDGIARGAPIVPALGLIVTVLIVSAVVFKAELKRRGLRTGSAQLDSLMTDMTNPNMSPDEIRRRLKEISTAYYETIKEA